MNMVGIAVIVAFVCMQTVYAMEPLSVQVSCQGCSERDEDKFYADAGELVVLTASSDGGSGRRSYSWTKDGIMVCERAFFQLTVAEDNVEYILIVTDDRGSVNKAVKVIPNFIQEPKCLPDFRGEITVRDYRTQDRKKYLAGSNFTVKIRLNTRDCSNPNYQFYWTADDPNIIFANSGSTETKVEIRQGAGRGKIKIEAIITNGEVRKDCDVEIEIVSSIPPKFEIEHDREIYSGERFKVWPANLDPGEQGDRYSAVLINESGIVVSSASPKTVGRNGKISYLWLKTDGFKEIYSIVMTVENLYGVSTTETKYIGNISRGENDENAPVVYAPNIIHCVVGKVCEIDASETEDKDRYVSNFRFYNTVAKEWLANPEGHCCSGSICNHIFTYPGTYKIRIDANYFEEDNIGSKIVTVIVSSGKISATPTPVVTPTIAPTSTPVSKPTAVKINAVKEPEAEKGGFEKIISGIIDIIDEIKSALHF